MVITNKMLWSTTRKLSLHYYNGEREMLQQFFHLSRKLTAFMKEVHKGEQTTHDEELDEFIGEVINQYYHAEKVKKDYCNPDEVFDLDNSEDFRVLYETVVLLNRLKELNPRRFSQIYVETPIIIWDNINYIAAHSFSYKLTCDKGKHLKRLCVILSSDGI